MDAEIEAEYCLNQACFSKGNKWLIILENGLKRGYFVCNLCAIPYFIETAHKNFFIYLINRKIYHI